MTELSIVIPYYNRPPAVVSYCFESIRRAALDLNVQILLVDDGSKPPARSTLDGMLASVTVVETENRGLLFARLAGLNRATGEFVLFLDSDDLVSEDKLRSQLAAMRQHNLDISYTDSAKAVLNVPYEQLHLEDEAATSEVSNTAEFCFRVQPAPHSAMFRRSFLRRAIESSQLPPSPLYNPVAEVWFYHVCAYQPGVAQKVAGSRAIIGIHDTGRITGTWERLAIGSLALMEYSLAVMKRRELDIELQTMLAGVALRSWRRLPRDFHPEFGEGLLRIAAAANNIDSAAVGGPLFGLLTRILGVQLAARVLRFRAGPYQRCRTMSDEEWTRLYAEFRARDDQKLSASYW